MKVSKYLRGSGRFLAFVFVASVLWLLFDMAALRLSNTDVNGQLMKELVLKERELAKRQNTDPSNLKRYPVQRENPDAETSQRSEMPRSQVVEAYMRKNTDWIHGENQAAPKSGGNIVARETKVLAGNDSQVHADTKSLAHYDNFKKQNAPSDKVSPGMGVNVKKGVLTKTKVPSAGQEGKRVKLQSNGTKIPPEIPPEDFQIPHGVVLSNISKGTLKQVKPDPSKSAPTTRSPKHKHAVQNVLSKLVVKDNKTDSLPVKTIAQVRTKPSQPHLNASDIQTGELLNFTKQGGLHKVMSLDVTLKPRDTRALGQFGWAAEVPLDDLQESRRRWSEGYFNVFLSEQIPVDRAIPDTRPPS